MKRKLLSGGLLFGALLFSIRASGQACTPGTIQAGSAALITPNCVSVSTSFDLVNRAVTAGNLASGTLVASTVQGMYGLRIYASPSTVNTLATVTISISWTEAGVARTSSMAALSLASTNNILQQTMPIYVDAGTAITYSATVTGVAGTFNLHIDGRPPQV